MSWVSLESLIKTSDLSHYKSSTSWSFNDLSQYFDTDWNLALLPMGNSRLLSKTNDEYIFSYAWASCDSYYAFPLKEKVNIKAIRYDAKLSQADYKDANVRLVYILYPDNFSGGSKRLIIAYANSITSEDFLVSDFNYHTYTKNLNEDYETEYICFSTVAGAWSFKNVEVLIEPKITSNGGGATHIAKRTGQLKDLSSYTSDILIVSGGGGGGLIVGEDTYTGKEAGGISGSGDNSADQTTGNAFGLGESGTNLSGGGSGLYGGYKGTSSKSGGAGSGYIGNSLLSNKKMVGYNVPTSSATGTKTESVEVYESNYVANKPKAGNGHCRIKLLNEVTINDAFDLFTTTDVSSKVVNSYSKDRIYLNPSEDTYIDFVSYLGNPDYMLVGGQDSNGKKTPTIDTVNKTIAYTNTSMGSSASWTLIPITQLSNVIKIKATIKFDSKYNQYSSLIVKLYYIDGNTLVTGNSYEIYIPWQSSSNYNVGDWYDLEVNCSMAKCDYICFGTGWDTVTFKNIKLYSM